MHLSRSVAVHGTADPAQHGADVPFTITRFSGFILSRHFTSIQLFRIGFVGATLSLCAIGFADSPTALWTGTAIFGMCCGTGSPFPALSCTRSCSNTEDIYKASVATSC